MYLIHFVKHIFPCNISRPSSEWVTSLKNFSSSGPRHRRCWKYMTFNWMLVLGPRGVWLVIWMTDEGYRDASRGIVTLNSGWLDGCWWKNRLFHGDYHHWDGAGQTFRSTLTDVRSQWEWVKVLTLEAGTCPPTTSRAPTNIKKQRQIWKNIAKGTTDPGVDCFDQ